MAYVATQRAGPSLSAPSDGSRTMVIHDSQPRSGGGDGDAGHEGPVVPTGALRLRGGPRRQRDRVRWTEDVVDNEHMGKKKSKICCIYHKPKKFDESSSEESSSDSESERTSDSSSHRQHRHHHRSQRPRRPAGDEEGPSSTNERDGSGGVVHELGENENEGETNAYERVPGKGSKKGKMREDGQ